MSDKFNNAILCTLFECVAGGTIQDFSKQLAEMAAAPDAEPFYAVHNARFLYIEPNDSMNIILHKWDATQSVEVASTEQIKKAIADAAAKNVRKTA